MVRVYPLETEYKRGILSIVTKQGIIKARVMDEYKGIAKKLKVNFK
jgi:hypothetical protein